MNSFLALIVLGIVQGITEFLPVSSSGHLVLLSTIFGIENSLFVSIILHIATLLSVVVALRKDVFALLRRPFGPDGKKIIVATIPTCLIVLIIYPFVTEAFEGALLPVCFIITAVILLITDFYLKNKTVKLASEESELSFKQAFFMGIAQGFATFPGISRSGSTICTGVLAGAKREKVAKFSFLMSIPVIILSMLMEIFKLVRVGVFPPVDVAGLVVGSILAFVIGVISIKLMIKLTQRLNFRWFSLYLVVLAVTTLFF